MDFFKGYVLDNWILVLILAAFIIVLATTAFLDRKATVRMYILIASVFIMSIIVFTEFYIANNPDTIMLRTVLMAIRYSATPFILAYIILTLVKRSKAFILIPAGVLLIIDIISIWTGIVFSITADNVFIRGPLGYLPFIVAGAYCVFLIVLLILRSNKRALEIIPIVFLAVSFASGLVFPFVFGPSFSEIFCPTIAVALFVYYIFLMLQLAKKDPLTGLLNRQAYYSETSKSHKDIRAIVSLDMNGLKAINDTEGHLAGDEALVTLALCFLRACWIRQTPYRIGGDEFVIVCHKMGEEEVIQLIERIKKNISETKYTCSIGYSYHENGVANLDDLLKESDEKMYLDKSEYYKNRK